MEFIMTYGWAILVVLVMISALAYFGVMNPNKYLPEKCIFSAGFNCRDFIIQHNGGNLQVLFKLDNKAGDNIVLQSVNATINWKGTPYSDLACGIVPLPAATAWTADSAQQFTCSFGPGTSPGVGQQSRIDVQLSYKTVTGTYNHNVNGLIQSQVQ